MQLIILAAGRGSRLPKKFRDNPKCLTKINGKTILEHNLNFYLKFKKRIIVTGYKNWQIKKFAKEFNFKIINNKKYRSTNMVYSLFLTKKFINDSVVICYGDIIFDKNIFKIFNKFENLIPLYLNWLSLWKKRMGLKYIKNDAEDVVVKNKKLIKIGTKIKKYPKSQFMGIVKISKNSYFRLLNFFTKNCDNKIDMTSFLNKSIDNKMLKLNVKEVKNFWFEIDTHKDVKTTSKLLKNIS